MHHSSSTAKSLKSLLIVLYALTVFALPTLALAKETLRIVAWEGYTDPEVVAEFERRFDVAVEVTYVNSDDDLWDKVSGNNGTNYDLFAVNTAELQRYIDKGVSVPIDLAAIRNHAHQLPPFRSFEAIPGLVRDNKIYAVPYTYSEMGLIYDRKAVREIPQSMAAMWNPAYRGRVLAYNTSNHNFTLAGMLLGAKDPFRLSDEEFKRAAKYLVNLRRNVLTFYTAPEEAVKWFTRDKVAIVFGNYGTQQVKALREAGADIGYVIPREGALAWLDCWAMTRGARNRKLAEMWIDYTLERPVSERLTTKHGLANTITPFINTHPQGKLIWLEPVEDPARRKAVWDRIMSGDNLSSL